tara:strand:- start:18 stop:383 length:366 start_codon:yes stop_codon:yes gene_type:complete
MTTATKVNLPKPPLHPEQESAPAETMNAMLTNTLMHAVRNGVKDSRAQSALSRLLPKLESFWEVENVSQQEADEIQLRIVQHWDDLFGYLLHLYGDQWDFFYHLEQILLTIIRGWRMRPDQ